VIEREPRVIDFIQIGSQKYTSGWKYLGYRQDYNISAMITRAGRSAPAVKKTGYIIDLPPGVTYTSNTNIQVEAAYEP
jgi:hypothetical protein